MEFVTKTGYMPVTKDAFKILPEYVKKLDSSKYRSLYEAIASTQAEYSFYTAPKLPNYLDLEMRFEKNVRLELARAKQEYEAVLEKAEAKKKLSDEEKWQKKKDCMEKAYNNLMNIMR